MSKNVRINFYFPRNTTMKKEGVRMHYKEYGEFMGCIWGWMWDKQVQYFSDYHCVVPELINEDADFFIEECAKKLLSLIEE